ncbi:small, acid-soluble spore protein, alpha/beta type [Cohnella yongneupensis]|uniref:Small, acid-soluble spore protein, alpha/beta type n=1 Tax=Cohnella yongneupensis TaxID=425006 RepID=A0ABW0R0P6_9BACL
MARRRKLIVPEAEQGVRAFKAEVMRKEGYDVDPANPDDVKYEVAEELGIPLQRGGNGKLTTEEAGQVGGQIGGAMVREMIRLAQEKMSQR